MTVQVQVTAIGTVPDRLPHTNSTVCENYRGLRMEKAGQHIKKSIYTMLL